MDQPITDNYEHMLEYLAILNTKYHAGILSEEKYDRLMEKLGEWMTIERGKE